MILEEFVTILDGTGLPVAYLAFPEDEPATLPFIVYEEVGSDNFGADNKVWFSAARVQVDLYTRKRDRTTEQLLEHTFNENEIFWQRVPDFDEDEDYYRVVYEIVI